MTYTKAPFSTKCFTAESSIINWEPKVWVQKIKLSIHIKQKGTQTSQHIDDFIEKNSQKERCIQSIVYKKKCQRFLKFIQGIRSKDPAQT